MSPNPLFQHMCTALDIIFPADPATIAYSLPEDSPLALPERTTLTLRKGEMIDVDLFQISADCWTAKDANHHGRTGVDTTREGAIADLVQMAQDDLQDSDLEENL